MSSVRALVACAFILLGLPRAEANREGFRITPHVEVATQPLARGAPVARQPRHSGLTRGARPALMADSGINLFRWAGVKSTAEKHNAWARRATLHGFLRARLVATTRADILGFYGPWTGGFEGRIETSDWNGAERTRSHRVELYPTAVDHQDEAGALAAVEAYGKNQFAIPLLALTVDGTGKLLLCAAASGTEITAATAPTTAAIDSASRQAANLDLAEMARLFPQTLRERLAIKQEGQRITLYARGPYGESEAGGGFVTPSELHDLLHGETAYLRPQHELRPTAPRSYGHENPM